MGWLAFVPRDRDVSFTAEELKLLAAGDAVIEKDYNRQHSKALHSAESVKRRIERIGREEWLRLRREVTARWAAKKKAKAKLNQETP